MQKQGKKYKFVGRTVKRNGALHMSVRPERLTRDIRCIA